MCIASASARLNCFLNHLPRMTLWLVLSCVLFAAAHYIAAAHPGSLLAVSLYKVHMVSLAGWSAYWLDRAFFPYARPHTFLHDEEDAVIHGTPGQAFNDTQPVDAELIVSGVFSHMAGLVMLRRALIAFGVLVCVGLGA